VADVFNRFLDSLQISHTRLLTPDDLEFHLFGGLWSPWNLDTLQVWHIGIQWTRRGEDLVVRTVLEDYPAARAGIRRGDVLVSSAGTKLNPLRSFDAGSPLLTLRRGGRVMAVPVEPVYESPHRSFLRAMRNSVRWIDLGTRRVAYVHLWTVFGPLMTEEFPRLIDRLAAADGIIVDLRDGYGGHWVPFLDAFFEDRRDYAVIESTARYGEPRRLLPDSVAPHPMYRGAVVAVINEGTRSGKEAIAFQFRKSRRGRLVGTTTAGHFRGAGFFPSRDPDYMLELAQTHLLLDGVDLEGRGVTPDVEVPWPLGRSIPGDPQLDRAIEEMKALLGVP
jgi:carboxyl-terminal processing protease